MKLRTGFVSNSSSSSFILKFDKIPETIEEMRILLFGENPPRFTTHWNDDDAISTEQVAKILFDDAKDANIFSADRILPNIKSEIDYFDEYSFDEGRGFVKDTQYEKKYELLVVNVTKEGEFLKKEFDILISKITAENDSREDFDKYYDKLRKLSEPMFVLIEKAINEKFNDEKFIELEYSDNDGKVFSYIEHGNALDNVIVQRFSHH